MFKKIFISIAFFTFLMYAILIASVFYFFDSKLFFDTLFSERTLYSIGLSLFAATFATALALIIAIPTAFALSRYNFKGKILIDIILELPMIVSPVALGAMLLIFFNNPFGNWIQENFTYFVFAVAGIILAQFITIVGVATRLIKAVIDEIPTRYEIVARTLGASPFKAFYTIILPLSKKGIISSSILAWAKALGEFGATVTIAGSMAMKTETLPTSIFMKLSTADIEGTVVSILILISIGLLVLFLARFISKNKEID